MNVSKIVKAANIYYLAVMAGWAARENSGWLMPDGEIFEEETGHAKAFNDWLAKKFPELINITKREFEKAKIRYKETGDGNEAELLAVLDRAMVFPSFLFGLYEFEDEIPDLVGVPEEISSIVGVPTAKLNDWPDYDFHMKMKIGDDSPLFSRDFGGIRFFNERMGNELNVAAWEWTPKNLINAQALVSKLAPNEVRIEEYSTRTWGLHDTEDFLKFRGFGRMWNRGQY